jgi:hypothetical protein
MMDLLVIIFSVYTLSITAGLIVRRFVPKQLLSQMERSDASQSQRLEKIFGKYRQALREGDLKAIAVCAGMVFAFNLLANFVQFTLLNILIIPAIFTVIIGGVMQGISLGAVTGSSRLSVILYLSVVAVEWLTYAIATAAGINVGLSLLLPERQAVTSHWQAFLLAWGDVLYLYGVIIPILGVQAVMEVLYVRKVLLTGGTAIPLRPY